MKAIVFDGTGGPDVLRLVDEPIPVIRPHDLLVRVHAAGVNRADILQRMGVYGDRPDYGDSLVPGLEIAGEVAEIGPQAEGYRVGDRIMAIVGGGGYADYARVDSRMCMAIPDKLTYVQAAAIPEVFVTAHEALIHLGELKPGDWVLIHAAAGGVGSAAIQVAHALGAKSVFTASGENRIAGVSALGGDLGVDYRKQDFQAAAMQATQGRGVDVVIDFIGGPYLDRNLRALAPGGRLIQVGVLGGSEAILPIDLLLYRYLRIIGTVMKSRSFEEKLAMTVRFCERWLPAFETGVLHPVVDHVFPLAQAADAHRAMEVSGKFGRIILSMD
ncbi:MAG: NAD(P)H-quinone oxidoreductase [Terriglobia bacterium]|nr:NAD(P)H-quinone oxidoreductase [Terriglobia bacterium]